MTKPRAYARLASELPKYTGTYTGNPNSRYVWVDEGGQPIITRNLQNYDTSKRTQWTPSLKTTGQTQLEEADQREVDKRNADEYASQYSVGNILGGLATPLNFTSPTQQIGAISDVLQGKKGYWESIGGGNSGIVTDTFQQNHPLWAAGINLVGDVAIPYTGYKTFTNVIRPTIVSQEINKMPLNKIVEIPSNIGWGPKQSVPVSHTSNTKSPLSFINYGRWDVVNEGANPHGIWFQGKLGIPRTVSTGVTQAKADKALKARELFAKRPYIHSGDLTLDKPLVTIGDVPNRSALSYQAEQMGADGLIYNNVYDNGYDANQVILSFKHPNNYTVNSQSVSEFVPSYVHESKASDLARPGKLVDDFYNHTFDVDVGDVAHYSEISDYIAPIERDVSTLNKQLYKDILQDNINRGLLSEGDAQDYYNIFQNARNNMRNYSSLPKDYQDAVVKSLDPNLVDRYFISNDGRIWGTFKVGDKWKGVTRPLNDGSSIQYITDARNSPATIAIHEGGHGVQTSAASQASGIDIRNFVGNDQRKIDFIEGLNNSELNFFKAQPPSVQDLLYTNRELFKNVPIREVTNVARDIRAMLTTKGIKTKDQLYKYVDNISEDELYNMYPQTNYLQVMRGNAQSKKDYTNFLKKLLVGTAFAAPAVTSVNQKE